MEKKTKENKREISKSKIEKRLRKKKDTELIRTIIKLKKTNPVVAKEFAKPRRKWPAINLKEIALVEEDVLIPGKVLSAGELISPKKIVAWNASKKALEKIKQSNSVFVPIEKEIKKNPKLNGLSILK